MQLGRVTGTVVATIKVEGLEGERSVAPLVRLACKATRAAGISNGSENPISPPPSSNW